MTIKRRVTGHRLDWASVALGAYLDEGMYKLYELKGLWHPTNRTICPLG